MDYVNPEGGRLGIRYDKLKRLKNESLSAYNNRIETMDDLHTGYAYFSSCVYDNKRHVLGMYIVWNHEFNSLLHDPLMPQGYVLYCSKKEAAEFAGLQEGLPVYCKVSSDKGQLFGKYFYLTNNSRNYVVSYIGLSVHKPDFVCFRNIMQSDLKKTDITESKTDTINSSLSGSFYMDAVYTENPNYGSFNIGSFNIGSFYIGSFTTGSFNMESFNTSSFNLSSFSLESFNLSSFNMSSFNFGSFNLGTFELGSFYTGSFANMFLETSSFNLSSFNLTSFNLSYFNLSSFGLNYFETSSFLTGSFLSGLFDTNWFGQGSFNEESFYTGSYTNSSFIFNLLSAGSFRLPNGSFNINGFLFGSYDEYLPKNLTTSFMQEFTDFSASSCVLQALKEEAVNKLYLEVFGIGCLGYGLNLI